MEILLGDPKAAIRSLSGPLVVSMLITSIYNLVDGIWVAGLGADALAGVGFVIPLFLVLIGLGNGLGGGATSAISRYIGEGDKAKADNGAIHSIILTIIISIIVTAMLLLVLDPVLTIMGAAHTLQYAHEYGMIMFLGTILFVLPNAMYGILRAEGDVKRTMYAMILSAVLNIILDPILIYVLGLGVAGAALATLISTGSVLLVLYYWMFVKKDTYLNPYLSNFKFNRQISLDILGVGIPASLEMIMTATFAAFFSAILAIVAGTDAVAVYSTGWRVVNIGMMPTVAISTALVSVVGANFGARRYENIRIAQRYSILLAVVCAVIVGVLIYLFAPQIVYVFSYSDNSAHLAAPMAAFLVTMIPYFILSAIGAPATLTFQGLGKGLTAMVQTIFRQLIFSIIFSYLFAITLRLGEHGAWWGIIAGSLFACILTFAWSNWYVGRLIKYGQA